MPENLISKLWNNPKNKRLIKDFLLFSAATVAFHFLYWNTDMNKWLFGPFTNSIFNLFTSIAYEGSHILMDTFSSLTYDCYDNSFAFYTQDIKGIKNHFAIMEVVHDCSAIKQLMQFLLIMLLCPNKLWKRLLYFSLGSIIILLSNIVRIFLLTELFGHNPDSFQYYHDWVARPLMYIVIFSLWAIWIQFFAYKKNKAPKQS